MIGAINGAAVKGKDDAMFKDKNLGILLGVAVLDGHIFVLSAFGEIHVLELPDHLAHPVAAPAAAPASAPAAAAAAE